jgi:hypothetical protein
MAICVGSGGMARYGCGTVRYGTKKKGAEERRQSDEWVHGANGPSQSVLVSSALVPVPVSVPAPGRCATKVLLLIRHLFP